MDIPFLAISIGNTRTQLGAFVEGKLMESEAIANESPQELSEAVKRLGAVVGHVQGAIALLSWVNPPVGARVEELLRTMGLVVYRVERDMPVPIGRQLDPESIVGEDRLLNAAAAYDRLKQACVIIDAGTAITVDFVDGAGTFHGGAIGPGVMMMLRAMHEGAAQLPEVEMARPLEPIGRSTTQAMRSAVFYGMRGMVRELVEQYAEVAGNYPLVIATGGDARMLFEDYDLVERIVPELTLLGMAVTMQATMGGKDQDQ